MIDLYEQMKQMNIQSDAKIVSMIVTAWSRKGDLKKMLETNEDLITYNLPPDQCTYRTMIDGYGKLGEFVEMEKYFDTNKPLIKQMWEAYDKMIEWYTHHGKPERAKELEDRRKEEAVEEPPKREELPVRGRRRR